MKLSQYRIWILIAQHTQEQFSGVVLLKGPQVTLMHARNENHCIWMAKLAGDQQFQVVRYDYKMTFNVELLFLERETGTIT